MKSPDSHTDKPPARWYGKRNRVIFLCTILGLVVGTILLGAFTKWASDNAPPRVDRLSTLRELRLTQPYPLTWKESGPAKELRLLIQLADFGKWYSGEQAVIQETSDGPRAISLVIPVPSEGATIEPANLGCTVEELAANTCVLDRGTLLLLRDQDAQGTQHSDQAVTETVWVKEVNGASVFMGFDCDTLPAQLVNTETPCYSPPPLQQLFGRLFGEHTLSISAEGQTCTRSFEWRGRWVQVNSEFACASAQSMTTFKTGMQMLRRMVNDASTPASPDTVRMRSQRAFETCELVDAKVDALRMRQLQVDKTAERSAYLCGYALQLLRARLETMPEEVAPQMVAVIGKPTYRQSKWDRWYLNDVVQALDKLAKPDKPTLATVAYKAESLRFKRLGWGYEEEEKASALKSLASLTTRIPQLTTLDFDQYDNVDQSLWSGVNVEARRGPTAAFVRAWYDKTKTLAPESDAALKIRSLVCLRMANYNFERSVLKECAESLLSVWEQKIQAGKPMEFEKEAWLVSYLVHMYQGYGYDTRDTAGALAGLARIKQLTELHLQNAADMTPALAELGTAETELAAFAKTAEPVK